MSGPSDPFAGINLGFVEQQYARFLEDSSQVDDDWRAYFADLAHADGDLQAVKVAVDGPGFRQSSIFDPPSATAPAAPTVAVVEPDDLPTLEKEVLERRISWLSGVKTFSGVGQVELEWIARLGTEEQLGTGDLVGQQGRTAEALFVVLEGHLQRRRSGAVYATLNRGEMVGELAVLDGQPWSADVVAGDSVRLLKIRRDDLLGLCKARPSIALSIMEGLSKRMRQRSWRQDRVNQLIHSYRVRGHLKASLDPLDRERGATAVLTLEHWGLSQADLDSLFSATALGGTDGETVVMTLKQIVDVLERTYCGSVGVQFMHIDSVEKKDWLIQNLEDSRNHRHLSTSEQRHILTKLMDAELFEQFIHKKFLGAKRFSLEGAETLIPLVDLAIGDAAAQGVDEVVVGMAHRGRLNLLVNILGKSASEVFREFADEDPEKFLGRGDVKYHLGYSSDQEYAGKNVHLSLCFNPSHLEFVNPVLSGRVRAKQDRHGDDDHRRCMGIAIHGDAAFAGQGVTQELLNMSELDGYQVGGTLHIIVNNQIGFTTPPESARSSEYATEVARMLQTPIFHVNGEDPEAVARVVRFAMDYRQEFQSDVVIDMYCYRRYGHNEGDEPSYTQPQLYEVIRKRKSVQEYYLDRLIALGGVTHEEAESIEKDRYDTLEAALSKAKAPDYELVGPSSGAGVWSPYRGGPEKETAEVPTGVDKKRLTELLKATTEAPAEFSLNPKLRKFMKTRREMADGEKSLDWGTAEALAFASLATDGFRVRLSGQDSGRGTFSHRHSVLHDTENGRNYIPLQHLTPEQAPFQVFDSPLSEIGVLGFEYGYSLDTPDGLILWEAQFGDFCNVAQVIIDQFITSGEDKWRRLSGLVMLLPHGFEGQGPEHSSARLERFLNMCAEDNIQVVNLTTPAQFFHCLRRQVLRPWRKPLVVMTPKSLLRLPAAVSPLEDLAEGSFQRLIGDTWQAAKPKSVKKVLLTSGKVYYELEDARRKAKRKDLALIRLEQYYPLDRELLEATLSPYADGTPVVWVQEEPRNMGAWSFLQWTFENDLFGRWPMYCVSRPGSASPATGSAAAHRKEQADLIDRAFNFEPKSR